jgi:sugar phosphate isomerase/epimerase
MEYGIQLYGCTDIYRKNPADFFGRIAEMGYRLIEPCVGFEGHVFSGGSLSPFLTPAELEEYAGVAKSFGLRIESCHVSGDLAADLKNLNKVIASYGIRHVMTGGPSGDYQKMFDGYTEKLKAVAAGIKQSGAKLCIHNSPAESRERIGAKTFLEAALERCGGEVGTQLDVGWALFGGVDPLDYMKKIETYLWSLHYKDIKKDYKNLPLSEIHICLGEGCLERVREIFEYARKLGIPQLIDQDKSDGDMMTDLEKSIKLLRPFE